MDDESDSGLVTRIVVAAPWVITTLIVVFISIAVWDGITQGSRTKHEQSLRDAAYGQAMYDSAAGVAAYAREQIGWERAKSAGWVTKIMQAEGRARIQTWKDLIKAAQVQQDKYFRYSDEYNSELWSQYGF